MIEAVAQALAQSAAVRVPQQPQPAPTEIQPVSASGESATPFISPRLRPDALSGKVIIEFRDSNSGEVQRQIPSQAAIAYLRAGLESDGTSGADAAKKPVEA